MRKVFLFLVVSLLAGTTAFAQNDKPKDSRMRTFDKSEMIKMRTDRVAKVLDLTKEQSDSLLKLNTEFAGKMNGNRMFGRHQQMKNRDTTAIKARRQMIVNQKANMEEYNKRLKNFLTEEQMAKYNGMQKKMQNQMHKQRMQNFNNRRQMPRQPKKLQDSNDNQ